MPNFLFIEGYYDELFFNMILNNLGVHYKYKYVRYSEKEDDRVDSYIKSIKSCKDPFLFVADRDKHRYSNETFRMVELRRRYPNLSNQDIILVVQDIESWYIAGLTKETAKKIKLKLLPKPDICTKSKFRSILPTIKDEIVVRNEILDYYDLQIALTKSVSLKKFVNAVKYL